MLQLLPPRAAAASPVAATLERTGVQGVEALAGGAAVDAVALNQAHEHQLGQQHSHDGLGVDQRGVAQVVQAALLEDLGAGLEPDSLAEVGDAVALQQLGGDAAQGACGEGGVGAVVTIRRWRRQARPVLLKHCAAARSRDLAAYCQLALQRQHAGSIRQETRHQPRTHRAWPSGHG